MYIQYSTILSTFTVKVLHRKINLNTITIMSSRIPCEPLHAVTVIDDNYVPRSNVGEHTFVPLSSSPSLTMSMDRGPSDACSSSSSTTAGESNERTHTDGDESKELLQIPRVKVDTNLRDFMASIASSLQYITNRQEAMYTTQIVPSLQHIIHRIERLETILADVQEKMNAVQPKYAKEDQTILHAYRNIREYAFSKRHTNFMHTPMPYSESHNVSNFNT